MAADHHELRSHAREYSKASSNRSFGLIVGAIVGFIALKDLWQNSHSWVVFAGLSVALLLAAWIAPGLLGPLNRFWHRLGLLLGKIMHPVVLALLFYIIITPIGLLARLAGNDFLGLRFDRNAQSYWTLRNPPGPAPETIKEQF